MADERFLSRELSWIAFNERVLELASEPGIPLLERAKFCAITSTNLDEFFQVRVAGLKDQIVAGIDRASMDGRTPTQQLTAIGELIPPLVERLDAAFLDRLVPELRAKGIDIVSYADTTLDEQRAARHVLRRAGLPGPHAARRRSRAPVPVHLRPRAVARGHRGRSGDRRPAVRPAQGAERVPAARPCGARPLSAGRATHRRPARPVVRRHGDRGVGAVPRQPQRRPDARGGGGRRPARSGRDGTAPSPVQAGGPSRGRPRRERGPARAAGARARTHARRRDVPPVADRPQLPVGTARTRTSRSEGPAVAAGHRRTHRRRRGRQPTGVRRRPPPRAARASPLRELLDAASRRSSARLPTTPGCSRSR